MGERRWNLMAEKKILRRSLYHRDGGRCGYCEEKLTFAESTLDHIIPIARGGTSDKLNLITSCAPCNVAKGDKLNGISWSRMAPWETRESLRENGYHHEAMAVTL